MRNNQIDIITLGCSKNLVDSDRLIRLFEANGYRCTHDSKNPQGEIAVINTCGFIGDAKEESINTILEFIQRKQEGKVKKLFVMGCLSQRYKEELEKELPQVDKFYGKFNYSSLLDDLGKADIPTCGGRRCMTTPRHYRYIKISEGCDRHCAYCAIPLITGRHTSRKKEEIFQEVRDLVAIGVKEFQVIAQDITYYGIDIDGKHHIADLIDDMAKIPGVKWIRLHYAYPTHFPYDLLEVIRKNDNVCNYLDIAFQHVSDHILSAMKRHFTKAETLQLVNDIRKAVPGIHLRTTLMVGFPGETEEDFQELVDFVKWARFERMGAFCYSEEEETYSAIQYKDDIPENVKQQRLDQLMIIQQEISAELAQEKIGKVLKVIIDRKEGRYYVGRTEYSSPEVDPEVLILAEDKPLRVGSFYQVKITDSEPFDLFGVVI